MNVFDDDEEDNDNETSAPISQLISVTVYIMYIVICIFSLIALYLYN